jgi:hypothetical protein
MVHTTATPRPVAAHGARRAREGFESTALAAAISPSLGAQSTTRAVALRGDLPARCSNADAVVTTPPCLGRERARCGPQPWRVPPVDRPKLHGRVERIALKLLVRLPPARWSPVRAVPQRRSCLQRSMSVLPRCLLLTPWSACLVRASGLVRLARLSLRVHRSRARARFWRHMRRCLEVRRAPSALSTPCSPSSPATSLS